MAEPLPTEISVQQAQALLGAGGARLVDVRDPEEYAFCRLPRAELIPLSTLPTDAAAKLPDRSAHIVLYCHHGMRSLRAAETLRAMGYAQAQSMKGGINRWAQEVDPQTPRY